MKKQIFTTITCLVAAFIFMGCVHAANPTAHQENGQPLQHTVKVTPEIKRAFRSEDGIEIRSITGTAPKFKAGGTYRVVGTCTQETLRNASLYLGNTAEPGPDAIIAGPASSLSKPLPNGTTEFDITFTVLRPGRLHVTIYDLDNHDRYDNAYAGLYLGNVVK